MSLPWSDPRANPLEDFKEFMRNVEIEYQERTMAKPCLMCNPIPELDAPERTSSDHRAVRFGDRLKLRVLVDGRDVTDDAFESMAGSSGWAAIWSRDRKGKRHICQTSLGGPGQHAHATLLRGVVTYLDPA